MAFYLEDFVLNWLQYITVDAVIIAFWVVLTSGILFLLRREINEGWEGGEHD
jgi:hypothetical protein